MCGQGQWRGLVEEEKPLKRRLGQMSVSSNSGEGILECEPRLPLSESPGGVCRNQVQACRIILSGRGPGNLHLNQAPRGLLLFGVPSVDQEHWHHPGVRNAES